MAPDNKTPVWGSGLNTQVDGKTLQFDPSAATTGMNAAGDLLRAMRGYKSAVDQLGLNHLPAISFLPSGKALAEGLSRRGTELQTAFDTHIDILTAMVETFRAAGQAYKNTDGLSAEQLDKATSSINKLGDYKIPDGEISAGFKTEPYRIGLLEQLPDHDFPGDLKKYRDAHKDAKDAGNFLDNVFIRWESGQNQQWEDLIRLHNELNGDPYYLAGQDWKTLADKVNTSIGDFGTKIEGLSNSWHGAGASGAREAVRRYARDAQPMLDTMKLMSELLDFTGRWVTWTKGCMPAHKEDKACTDDLGNYRRYFDRDYVGNGKDTQSVMPVMPQPTVDKPEPVKPPEKPDTPEKPKPKDGDDGKGGGKADTGGGGGGGGGGKSDAGGGGNQKAAQDAKDAADKKAAQDAKDAADRKAAQDAKDAAENKAAQDAKDAADNKAAQDARDAAAKKAAEDAKNAQNGAGSNNGSGPGGVPSTGGTTSPASNSSSSGQGLSQLSSLLSSLAQAGTTAAQSLPSLLTAIDSALNTGDNAKLAQLLGVSEDKITAAMSQIQNQPDKLAELSQLLGLTNGTTTDPVVPAAGLPGEVAPSGAAVVTPAAAAVTTTPAGGLTNLFPRAGLDLGVTQPVFGVTADLSDNPMISGVTAGADHEPPPVDFLGVLAQVGEPHEVNPVVET
ncbi:hypothetical protein OHB26_07010 [Nocardia sp. NBC_01503]|uniref:hypothetical protein n=1 Tax=Nocardia sp. NBC_01503 TaxID=2975997 RepID=UPI002E7BAF0E|nr:hypothetical protein [Nocardia sp. NBC_01503]WTL33959.1 hypothetical protein OHB26_07010 [Nocardia sp. NBC_01503]